MDKAKLKDIFTRKVNNLVINEHIKIKDYYLYSHIENNSEASKCTRYTTEDLHKLIDDYIRTIESYSTSEKYIAIGVNYNDYARDLIYYNDKE